MEKVQEGDYIVTCGLHRELDGAGRPVMGPKVYQAFFRKKDQVLVWRLSHEVDLKGLTSKATLTEKDAFLLSKRYARNQGYMFEEDIKHNLVVNTLTFVRDGKKARRGLKMGSAKKRVRVPAPAEVPSLIGRFRRIDSDDII